MNRRAHDIALPLLLLLGACALPATAAGPGTASRAPFKDCGDCPEMVAVPGGAFAMGAAPGEEQRENLADEFRGRSEPRRTVDLKPFHVARFEITRAQYRVFAETTGRPSGGCFVWNRTEFELDASKDWRNPGFPQDGTHPVACVSWDDANAYVVWLSKRTGKRYRLLSEAEWEYAARAGSATTRFWGDDASASCEYANGADVSTRARVPGTSAWPAATCNDRHAYTAPVGSFRPNAFGLHDMLGNVEEWTQDCWSPNYEAAPSDGSARSTGDCALRAVRGGSWDDAPVGLRAAYRVGSPTTVRVYRRGFRIARDL